MLSKRSAGWIVVAGLTLSGSVWAQNTCESTINSTTGITNFHIVVPGKIFRGSRPTSLSDVMALKNSCGVGQILNLQGGDPWYFNPIPYLLDFENGELKGFRNQENSEAQQVFSAPEDNIVLDSFDSVDVEQEVRIEQAVNELDQANTVEGAKPLFLHCQHGIDRTGMIVALFKVLKLNVPPSVALDEWMRYAHDSKTPVVGGLISYCENRAEGIRCVNKAMKEYFDLATAAPMGLHKVRDQAAARAQEDQYP